MKTAQFKNDPRSKQKMIIIDHDDIPSVFSGVPLLTSSLYRLLAATDQPRLHLQVTREGMLQYFIRAKIEQTSATTAPRNAPEPGLASLLVASLFLGQSDFNPANIHINANREVINHNYTRAFFLEFQHQPCPSWLSFHYTHKDLKNLPFVVHFTPAKWLNIHDNGHTQTYRALSNNRSFLFEKYQTLLKIILTPTIIFKQMIDDMIVKTDALSLFSNKKYLKKILLNRLITQQHWMEQQAFYLSDFREFIFTEPNQVSHIIASFKKEIPIDEKTEIAISNKANAICTLDKLKLYLSDHRHFSMEYKVNIFKHIFIDLINSKNKLADISSIIEELQTKPEYRFIKEADSDFFGSLFGYIHDGQPVSNSFSNVMEAAKQKMLSIIEKEKLEDIAPSHHHFLTQHRHGNFVFFHTALNKETASGDKLKKILTDNKLENAPSDDDYVLIPLISPHA